MVFPVIFSHREDSGASATLAYVTARSWGDAVDQCDVEVSDSRSVFEGFDFTVSPGPCA